MNKNKKNEKVFFVLGPPKAGTTTLFSNLVKHSKILNSKYKETHFFSNQELYKLGFDWYLKSYFRKRSKYWYFGEATPAYLLRPTIVGERLKSFVKERKFFLIIILREPIERTWSHYLHLKRNALINSSLDEVIDGEFKDRVSNPFDFRGCYGPGLYDEIIKCWLSIFPKSSFIFIDFDELKNDVVGCCQRIFLEMGLEAESIKRESKKNKAGEAKIKALNALLNHPPEFLKIGFNYLVPKKMQHELLAFIRRKNTKIFLEKPKISASCERKLADIFSGREHNVEKLTGIDLKNWTRIYKKIGG